MFFLFIILHFILKVKLYLIRFNYKIEFYYFLMFVIMSSKIKKGNHFESLSLNKKGIL